MDSDENCKETLIALIIILHSTTLNISEDINSPILEASRVLTLGLLSVHSCQPNEIIKNLSGHEENVLLRFSTQQHNKHSERQLTNIPNALCSIVHWRAPIEDILGENTLQFFQFLKTTLKNEISLIIKKTIDKNKHNLSPAIISLSK